MTISTTSTPQLSSFPTWLYLQRSGSGFERSSFLLSPYQFKGAQSVQNIYGLKGASLLNRPLPPAGDYRSISTFKLSNELSFDCDVLAGGSIDELRISGRNMLNTYRGWTRGWQAGLEFSRRGVRCWPRTGGSVYSGETATHPVWWTGGSAPGATIGTHDSTLAVYNGKNERQGAWCQNVGIAGGPLEITTIPIELDPDGFCGGDDHGILEYLDSGTPPPEQLLPVLYYGLRICQKITVVATGVMKVEVRIDLDGKDQMDLDGAWVFDAARIHLRGEVANALLRIGSTTFVLNAENIPAGGGATYDDQGFFYELGRGYVKRGAAAPLASTIANAASGTIIKECCGRFIAIRMGSNSLTDTYGNALAETRSFTYSNRMDLTAGDAKDGERHHFIGARYAVSDAKILSGMTATFHVVTANSLPTLEARIDAITP